jgi:SAM-dependent methyltransferase
LSTPDFRFILGGGMDSGEYKKIYHNEAQRYEALVSREDYQGNILPALLEINELDGRVIVEPGAGTGRLTKLLAPRVSFVYGFDISPAMLAVAREELARTEARNWALAVADHAHLPLPPNSADVIISGWSLCYLALDQPEPWREPLRAVFSRFEEILRPGGTIIILETMGTGHTTPNPPDFMGDYFGFLEELGFSSTWIRTDYRFESPEEAQALSRFFFGDELGDQVARSRSAVLPECTGIWWK